MSFCKIQFIGNLGRDPEMRYTPSGKPVTEFNVAVNQGVKDKQTGEWTDETDWFRCTVWGDAAERAAEQLRKGNRVLVEGRFKTRAWQTREGEDRISMEVTVNQYVSLEKREREDGDSGFGRAPARTGSRPPASDNFDDLDDLPF